MNPSDSSIKRRLIIVGLAAAVIGIAAAIFYFLGQIYATTYLSIVVVTILFLPSFFLINYKGLLEPRKEWQLISDKSYLQEILLTIIDNSPNGLALIKTNGTIVKANRALCDMFEEDLNELMSKNFFKIINDAGLSKLEKEIKLLLHSNAETNCSQQNLRLNSQQPTWANISISTVRKQEQIKYFVVEVQDISLQMQAEESLSYMAYHDPLTGLANRNRLEQFIDHIFSQYTRMQESVALIFIDLDSFKNINDTIGHDAGDLLLQIIAARLKGVTQSSDLVARLGGDEFIIVITGVKKSEAVATIASKILQSIMKPAMIKGQELFLTTSIGISLYPFDGQNLNTLMKNADLALYRSKERGKNNYQFYTIEMTSKAQERLALQNAVARALVNEEFVLNYLPKMDLQSKRISGLEALLRWKNTQYTVTPNEIITVAEETGLIEPVSEWVLRTACQHLKKWHELGYSQLSIAINCTARQISQQDFSDTVARIAGECGISPNYIEIEITEKLIMEDSENILPILYKLKDLGVKIVIDDFGTGYWSLNTLRKLSIDQIKIDISFIKTLGHNDISTDIVKAVIAMATKLGIKSVAEGVETREQFLFLAKEGCTEIQGYYLTRPLDADALTLFLKHPLADMENQHSLDDDITV